MATFALHPQLAADGLFLVDWPLCRVLRMNDAAYPWLVLVPRLTDAREIMDLSAADRVRLMDEIARHRFSRMTPHERDALYAYLKARAERP